jgi:hypothetical protein
VQPIAGFPFGQGSERVEPASIERLFPERSSSRSKLQPLGCFNEVSSARSSQEEGMPAKSAAQQKAAGAALSAKRGDTPKSKLRGASKSMADSMSEKELEKMASTKRKGKPEHASKSD